MIKQRQFVYIMLLVSTAAKAQVTLPVPRNIQAAYDKGTRTVTGEPGKQYWQNTANYSIAVQFDPATRLLNGTVDIDYVNNSPTTLRLVTFKLYPNIYKKGSARLMKVNAVDLTDGVHISLLEINKTPFDTTRLRADGTNLPVPIPALAPGGTMHFTLHYSYTLNKTSHIRTGEIEPGAAFIAYFFPRIAVYDDVDGWNMEPYLGPAEFYNDFANFNVSVSVPANYVVWATGDLTNCSEVLNDEYCRRLQTAEQKDEVTTIIDSTDIQQKNITRPNAVNTWKFSAANVTDFAFAVSDHYMWKSTSLVVDAATQKRTRVDAVFNPKHKDYYDVIGFARKTVWAMSYVFPKWPFPYAHETVVDGLDQMEYPMMVNDNPLESRAETIELVDHEIFHTMFPFYMGINETKYGWMDEGWATIGEWLISSVIDSTLKDEYGVRGYENLAGTEKDPPISTLTPLLGDGSPMFVNSYPKPGMGYLFVKDLLGDSLFTHALHYYIRQWQGKHPIPFDFFYCMNTGSGKNLDWFWKRWFFDGGVPDLAIKKVNKTTTGYSIAIDCKGHKPVPVDVKILFNDSSTVNIHRPVAVWENANSLVLPLATKKTIKTVSLGSLYTPDVNKKDNVWSSK